MSDPTEFALLKKSQEHLDGTLKRLELTISEQNRIQLENVKSQAEFTTALNKLIEQNNTQNTALNKLEDKFDKLHARERELDKVVEFVEVANAMKWKVVTAFGVVMLTALWGVIKTQL